MKRLIKFRGKRTDTGEWIFGDLLTSNETECEISDWNDVVYSRYDVDPDTVGQYWRTVNNQELYDGDILTVNGKYPKLVRWIEEKGCFCIANISELDYSWVDAWQPHPLTWFDDFWRGIKIIGNEFDNPELLKGGNQ